jgi:hypothetical protein
MDKITIRNMDISIKPEEKEKLQIVDTKTFIGISIEESTLGYRGIISDCAIQRGIVELVATAPDRYMWYWQVGHTWEEVTPAAIKLIDMALTLLPMLTQIEHRIFELNNL